jgi:exonuclease III
VGTTFLSLSSILHFALQDFASQLIFSLFTMLSYNGTMLIVSWNVAGLKPALQRIHEDYSVSSSCASSSSSSTASSNGVKTTTENNANYSSTKNKQANCPFTNYLQLHGDVDILCLQEHKIPLTQLSSRAEPHRCSTIDGYESFWSCATDAKSRGFNGVVTYAKVGLVQSADSAPLKDVELDSQGRCVMTDHDRFVLFNVYVPNGIHTNKMKFLHALQNAMREQRTKGKHVVLVGDMNLKIDKRDIYWKHRVVNVDELLRQQQQQTQHEERKQQQCIQKTEIVTTDNGNDGIKESPTVPPPPPPPPLLSKWKMDVQNHWDKITTVLETIEAVPCQTTNPNTKQTFNRWRARVKLADNNGSGGKYVILGTYEDTAEDALFHYTFGELSYEDSSTNTPTICRKKNVLSVEVLTELMSKIANVSWDIATQREIANSTEANLNPDSPPYLWMKRLLDEDKMVDVFRHMYPEAEGRFTCWHQQKNRRYVNEGGRIDFTLVDSALLGHVDTSCGNLRCGTKPHDDPNGEEAALMACTANGMFQAPSFSGGGIAQVSKRALDSQFGPPHTGMIYTPPSYSDHIAISLLMKESFNTVVGQLSLQSNASTRKSQPHKKQKSMMSFLCAPGATKKAASSNTTSSSSASASSSTTAVAAGQKRPAQQQEEEAKNTKPNNNLKSFFAGPPVDKKSSDVKSSSTKSASNKRNASQDSKKQKKNSLYNHFSKK